MLKVWGRATSVNVQKVMWTLAELGVPCERIDVGGAYGGTDTDDYLAMNPNRLVPTLEDGDTVIWESHAIVRYLAQKHGAGSFWPEAPAARARADMWMDWIHTTWGPAFTIVFHGLVRTPSAQRDMSAIHAAAANAGELLRMVDSRLASTPYLTGEQLTMGDIPVATFLYRYFTIETIERPSLPNLESWYQRLCERDAYKEHVMVSYDSLRAKE